ncbi:MAG: site-2 protease family protein [Clostridia bacterium]|nr:site-2 protease family protein [Clostridia bacterium]
MIAFIINALKIIFVLGFLVFIHEGGHFLVAKLCKVKVNEFSIGWGPALFKKQGKETLYALRLIPLGGYVRLEGEEEESKDERAYSNASIPKRMAIILAGPFVNIVFAIVTYFILVSVVANNSSLIVKELIPNYAAEGAGIIVGDEITKINGQKLYVKSDLDKALEKSNGEEIEVTVKRNNEEKNIKLIPTKVDYKHTGIYLKSIDQAESTKVITAEANSVAERSGVIANDIITKVNGEEVKNQLEIVNAIDKSTSKTIDITIKRGNEEKIISIEPDIYNYYYLGVQFETAENTFLNNIYYAFFNTKEFVFSIFENLKMLLTGGARINQFVGPVGISQVVANTNEVKDFVNILALVSLSLGVTNLLPIPALDGGKFVLLVIEAIRKKKLDERIEMSMGLISFILLIILSVYVTYNDILRIL